MEASLAQLVPRNDDPGTRRASLIRPHTRYLLCVLLACSRVLASQVTAPRPGNRGPADYAAIAAADFRTVQARVARLVAGRVVDVVPDCGKLAETCRALKTTKFDTTYSARLLDPRFYVALLPSEVTLRGLPYYAWVPVGEVRNGAAVLERWNKLASDRATLGCKDDACTILVLQPPDQRHAATTISACRVDGSSASYDPPSRCDALAIVSRAGSWLRSVIGWGNAAMAADLGSSPIVEDYEVEESLSILQLPAAKRAAVVQALETALKTSPLLLTTEFRPPVNPSAVKVRRASAESQVIRDFREWANVRADVEPAVRAAGDTTVSAIELTTILWLSRTASPQPTRPASATESASYHARVRTNVMREIAQVCGAVFAGSRIVCR